MKRFVCLLMTLIMVLGLFPTAALAAGNEGETQTLPESIGTDTVWSYLDDGTDPAGDSTQAGYDRTSWTAETFNTDGWKAAAGPFGSKKGAAALETGYTAATVLTGCDGSNDTPAYFFRTTFNVTSLEGMTKLNGTLQYDDAATVYINGVKVAGFDDSDISANLQYGGSNAGTPKTVSFELLDLSILHTGANTIAVELHQGRASSSDVWFHLTDLSLSDEEVDYHSNISLSMGADESKVNFTWYSPLSDAELLVADNAAMTGAQTIEADTSVANDGQYSCKATATGLAAGKTYYYQLSNAGHTSESYHFTTDDGGAFSFAFVGDPQIGASGNVSNDAEGWGNTLNSIGTNGIFSDVSFLLSAGDQVNTAADENQYDGYLDHDVLTSLPVATAIGNHDSGSNAYSQHFNVPNESAEYGRTAAGGDYYFVYNNVLFMVLNSNVQTADGHKAFMEAAIEATKDENIQWKIVMFHHTLFTVASHAHDGYIDNENGFKAQIIPVLKELDVDVVLQGHDHVYCRTYMMDGTTPMTDKAIYDDEGYSSITDPTGILYVTANSGSGSKTYGILNETFGFSAVQNQESAANVSKVTVSDQQLTITTYRTSDMAVVDTFTINRNIPVVTGDTRVTGYYNENGSLKLELAGRYNSGAMNEDGGSLEIVQYNPVNGFAYAVSGVKGKLIAVDLNGKLDGNKVVSLNGKEYDVKSLVSGFAYGDMTSVAISPDGSKLAVAIQAENYAEQGAVALFNCDKDGSLKLLSTATVGVQPDMVTFADNSTILSADEGEPRGGKDATDPKGSVSIVTIGADNTLTANTVYFDSFDDKRSALTDAGVLIQENTQPSTDFEPEYIAVSGNTAYVSLQEANAIAVLDIANKIFTGVYPLGFQDYGVTKVDLQKNDTIELKNYEHVYGIRMPDGISVTTIGGKTYLLTANEGDSRADWTGLGNESEGKTSPTGNVALDSKVVWFNANLWDGLDESKAYVFGGRSFSIYEATETGLTLVYDSGSGFETITAKELPDYFNCSNDKISLDNRSGKKGPEPESVVTGVVNGKTYAFIALERIGGVMVYDITDPANTKFVNYINSREFDAAIKGDVSPEGLCFISAANSKTGQPLLLTACEVSGTLAAYELTVPTQGGSTGSTGGSSSSGKPSGKPQPEPTPDPEPAKLPFTDVKSGDWFYDGVAFVQEKGIMKGMTDDTFGPSVSTTRGMVATMLWRMENEPQAKTGAAFADVKESDYYAGAVAWAAEQGIVNGVSETAFAPDQEITREQLAVMLYRYSQIKGYDLTGQGDLSGFGDGTQVSGYAVASMQWAVGASLIQGTDTGLVPAGSATRAQLATILYRFLTNLAS
ncbi:MAG: choice-of-anchor I family protein [Bacillota bacterium]|nr:choice-of-anchor I family protein [Bacillota bacterium]